MDVLIQENSFSLGVKYDIELPTATWTATKRIFSLLADIEVHDATGDLLATLHGEFAQDRGFRFELSDGRTYEYHCEKLLKGVYDCAGDGESFRLYTHKGWHHSIFQNDVQIAAINQDAVSVGNRSSDMRVNRDANVLVLICMVLAINCVYGADANTSVFNLGHIGPEDRPFDTSWHPIDEAADKP